MRIGYRGQSLIEFVASLALVIVMVLGLTAWLSAEWERTRCVYQVFEATHARLVGLPVPEFRVSLRETASAVQGEALCGKTHEQVELPRLEAAQW